MCARIRISGCHRHYLFDGSITHRDSEGNIQEIQPGAMTDDGRTRHRAFGADAGRAAARRPEDAGLQSWIALAGRLRGNRAVVSAYGSRRPATVTDRGFTARVIAGSSFGVKSPVTMVSPWFTPR